MLGLESGLVLLLVLGLSVWVSVSVWVKFSVRVRVMFFD